ncbi:hypothetical protein GWI33_011522, partial [Rhynchophorus ferrugineus]
NNYNIILVISLSTSH